MKDDDAFDENGVLKDGRTVRVGMRIMDGRNTPVHDGMGGTRMHQPGCRYGSEFAELRRAEARDAYVRQISEEWRGPASQQVDPEPVACRAVARDEPYEAYDEWLRNAWRGAR